MECPKCQHVMEEKHFGSEFFLMRCVGCLGMWCKVQNLSQIEDVPMLDILDVGQRGRGLAYNQMQDIGCPNCGVAMQAERVPRQPHIEVEVCHGFQGVFFDAGELRDAMHYTVRDWIKGLSFLFPKG